MEREKLVSKNVYVLELDYQDLSNLEFLLSDQGPAYGLKELELRTRAMKADADKIELNG